MGKAQSNEGPGGAGGATGGGGPGGDGGRGGLPQPKGLTCKKDGFCDIANGESGLNCAADCCPKGFASCSGLDVPLPPVAPPSPSPSESPVESRGFGASDCKSQLEKDHFEDCPSFNGATYDENRWNMCLHMDISVRYESLYRAAKNRWEQVITGDRQWVFPKAQAMSTEFVCPGGYPELIDDLYICARESCIDGPGKILGQAAAIYSFKDTGLPVTGYFELDSDDMAELNGYVGALASVITHEMGHIIGIGTALPWIDRVETTRDPSTGVIVSSFKGAEATRVWNEEYNCNGEPPVETGGGSGTTGGHWSEDCLVNELMTGYLVKTAGSWPLSSLTVAAISDLGYDVDFNAADPTKPIIDSACCKGNRRTVRSLRGGGEKTPLPRRLSSESVFTAIDYGKKFLKKAHDLAPVNKLVANGTIAWVADQHVEVFMIEDGVVYSVGVDSEGGD